MARSTRARRPCALPGPLLNLLQHQLKAAPVLLDLQLLGEIAVVGRDLLRYQPGGNYQRAYQATSVFCPAFCIHAKFVPRASRAQWIESDTGWGPSQPFEITTIRDRK